MLLRRHQKVLKRAVGGSVSTSLKMMIFTLVCYFCSDFAMLITVKVYYTYEVYRVERNIPNLKDFKTM